MAQRYRHRAPELPLDLALVAIPRLCSDPRGSARKYHPTQDRGHRQQRRNPVAQQQRSRDGTRESCQVRHNVVDRSDESSVEHVRDRDHQPTGERHGEEHTHHSPSVPPPPGLTSTGQSSCASSRAKVPLRLGRVPWPGVTRRTYQCPLAEPRANGEQTTSTSPANLQFRRPIDTDWPRITTSRKVRA
jgi:hypothetical protein